MYSFLLSFIIFLKRREFWIDRVIFNCFEYIIERKSLISYEIDLQITLSYAKKFCKMFIEKFILQFNLF